MSSIALRNLSSFQNKPLIRENEQSLQYGTTTIRFNLTWSKRETLEIAVYPDQTVWVTSPEDADIDQVHEKVRKRARWIVKQLRYFSRFDPLQEHKEYISGETHYYLGRQYRLKVLQISPEEKETVKLKGRYFQIR